MDHYGVHQSIKGKSHKLARVKDQLSLIFQKGSEIIKKNNSLKNLIIDNGKSMIKEIKERVKTLISFINSKNEKIKKTCGNQNYNNQTILEIEKLGKMETIFRYDFKEKIKLYLNLNFNDLEIGEQENLDSIKVIENKIGFVQPIGVIKNPENNHKWEQLIGYTKTPKNKLEHEE